MPPFKKILIANRGEIAVRIIRACRDLGISPVVVYSDADREALHVKLSDEARCIGPSPSTQSYLVIEKIIDAAQKSGAEAIHPGYGFLAENEKFAQACADSRLVFIGPSAASMKLMGNKIASRAAVHQAGVPIVPGTERALQSMEDALTAASQIGYPVMLKASAGGGGKGLRVVSTEQELRSVYETARSEARSSFNDATVFMEKYLVKRRHIEIQVLGDLEGNLIHLAERECSIQRRHQKLVEESPSPLVDNELRQRLGEAAVAVARTADYYNAGTVEFMVEAASTPEECKFYFLEMNTRLQVEHPVTEMVTGIDLVREQILVAAGQKLGYGQEDIQLRGAAIECRVYAEDPQNKFLPSPGKINTYFEPSGPGVRTDSGVCAGSTIPIEYDPLISKVVAYGEGRKQAIVRMRRALREYRIAGVRTTIPFFEVLLSHPMFVNGDLHTHFIEEHQLVERMEKELEKVETIPLIAAAINHFHQAHTPKRRSQRAYSLWKNYGRFPHRFRKW
ncbi:acetyl-CoA carboxylase biotin carboxylase subunit [Acidobacteria bacterium AH-259-A15]|nr:acetyl-CoA carboxylase biotin carboxylase subunit [Acidobacteria bacterium AH-259-A15]